MQTLAMSLPCWCSEPMIKGGQTTKEASMTAEPSKNWQSPPFQKISRYSPQELAGLYKVYGRYAPVDPYQSDTVDLIEALSQLAHMPKDNDQHRQMIDALSDLIEYPVPYKKLGEWQDYLCDKIDFMSLLTELAREEALELLEQAYGHEAYPYLRIGYLNTGQVV